MPTPVKQSVSFTFQDPAGNPLAGGTAVFRLNEDISSGTVSGPQIAAERTVSVTLDGAGSCTVLLWPNNTMSPPGTVYFVDAYSAIGQPAWGGQMTVVQ